MKYIIMIIALSLSLMAADATKAAKELGIYNDYGTGLKKAKSENKLMILTVVWNPCGGCDKLVKETLTNTTVKNKLKDYITVILDYQDKMPKEFHIKMAPKMFYINPKTEEGIWESMGVISVKSIMSDFKEAQKMLKETSK